MGVPGHEQERHSPLVRHVGVWQSCEGPSLLRPSPIDENLSQEAPAVSIRVAGIEVSHCHLRFVIEARRVVALET